MQFPKILTGFYQSDFKRRHVIELAQIEAICMLIKFVDAAERGVWIFIARPHLDTQVSEIAHQERGYG